MKCDAKRLAEIEAREKAASPGPWREGWSIAADFREKADRIFTARARTDVPDLLADLREARAALAPCGVESTADLLEWATDRLVRIHGESPNADFVLALRRRATLIRSATPPSPPHQLP